MAHFMHMVLAGLQRWPDAPLIRPFISTAGTNDTGTHTTQGTTKGEEGKGEYAWGLITFRDFERAVERTAGRYQAMLGPAGVRAGDVVGLWLTGEHVSDLTHLYALARAGYAVELFSLKFSIPGSVVVRDLLAECRATALVYDVSFATLVSEIPLPVFPLADTALLEPGSTEVELCPGPLPEVNEDDVAIIFHTSGTTGGRPKPVPQSHGWCKAHSRVCWRGIWQGKWETPDVVNNIGSFAHMGASTYIYKSAFSGGSFVQTSRPDIGADEFLALVRQCGLNRLLQYGSWLSALVRVARVNPEVLDAMRGLRQVVYTGVSMNPEDEKWAIENGIPVTSLYGTTETAQCMISELGARETSMRPIPELGLQLVPALHAGDSQTQLYDLFLPASAPNCPHPTVRNRPDGHVTGDLFEEVRPGYYAFRGRGDDWIKTGSSLSAFCDTKAIEDNVLRTCPDIVRNCVAVGHLKPWVVLLVEPSAEDVDEAATKTEILRRTAEYNSRLLEHERIVDESRIVVVRAGSLPRTSEKGNIRRKAAHEQFASELAAIWGDA